MTRLKIGPDDAANGVYLPPGTHRKTFGNDYFKALDERLKRIDESSRELNEIGREIEEGVFP